MVDYIGTYEDMGFTSWKVAWWDVLLRGLIAIVFGLMLFFLPGLSLKTFLLLFAAFSFVDGVLVLLQMVTIKDGRWLGRLIHGIIALAAAAAVVMYPGLSLLMFVYLLAFYWISTGVLEILLAIDFRKVMKGELLFVAAGILAIIVGGLLLVHPLSTIVALAQVVGIFNVAFGIILVLLAVKLALTPARAPVAA